MLREFCAQNLEHVREALLAGADRVELCDDLSVGGVSPSDAVIHEAVALVHGMGGRVMVMVRPRAGDFAYDDSELEEMERVIGVAGAAGADGAVFGCVREGALDVAATRRLVRAAQAAGSARGSALDLTFHMAFDEIEPSWQAAALAELAELGFSRVLTHGGPLSEPIESCLPRLQAFVGAAKGRVGIMPGGGVSWENAEHICEALGVGEAHGTRIVRY